jgi:hypothetical protein
VTFGFFDFTEFMIAQKCQVEYNRIRVHEGGYDGKEENQGLHERHAC